MEYKRSIYQKIKQHKLWAALIVVFWLFLFLTTVSKTYAYFVRNDIPVDLGYILAEAFFIWSLIALFVPVFSWFVKKYPIEGEKKVWNTGIHILISLFWVPVHALLFEIIMNFMHPVLISDQLSQVPFSWGTVESYLSTIIWMGLVVTFSYWLVVGGWHLKKYYTQFKERQLKNTELEAELSTIRLHVLKSQLHPHFLFNTLHNVHTLIQEDADTAEEMLRFLKRFLQISIQRVNDQKVPLREEVEFTNIYLEIEQVRFSNRLTVEKEIDPDTLNAIVPSLMLQPLVENAVCHGVSKKITAGIIKITSQKAGTSLCLTVEDNGPGLDGEVNSTGVGLKNIKQRLEYLYKEPEFWLASSLLGGLKVQIEIPFETSKITANP